MLPALPSEPAVSEEAAAAAAAGARLTDVTGPERVEESEVECGGEGVGYDTRKG